MPRSSKNSPFGPRPSDAEVREALAQGLPNPRWQRQNRMAREHIKQRVKESELYAQQQANYDSGVNFGRTEATVATEDSKEANHVDGLDRDNIPNQEESID